MDDMHDWVLNTVLLDWSTASANIAFDASPEEKALLVADGVTELNIPQKNPWGPSMCVNAVEGPISLDDGVQALRIEMQSGDVVSLSARTFTLQRRPK